MQNLPLLFVMSCLPFLLWGQRPGANPLNKGNAVLVKLSYAAHMPGGDLETRFGNNFSFGAGADLITAKGNWLFGFDYAYLFGGNVKEDVLASLRTPEGAIIGNNRGYADITLRERGFYAGAHIGKLIGIGLATYVEACGGGGPEWATVRVARSGDITVTIGTQSNGQGHETAYKQLVAEQLGVAPDRITVVQGDTTIIARGSGTGGSRSIPVGGASVNVAALAVQDRAKALAADYMEAAVADIHYEEGRFSIVGTDRSMTLAEIAQRSPTEVAMEEQGSFKPPAATFPNGAHVVEVEVDPETGGVEIVRYTVVDDFGRVLNPLMLAGQVHGGVAQGVGQALLEHTVFDSEGQLLTGSLMDYALPRADVLPFLTFQYNEVPCTTNPLGVKGAGEAGAIGAPPAIINAVVDALAPLGIEHVDMPATPDAVWALIQAARPAPLSSNGLAAQ